MTRRSRTVTPHTVSITWKPNIIPMATETPRKAGTAQISMT